MSVHHLSTIRLDPKAGYRREAPKGVTVKADSFWERYDSQTLIYDAIHCRQTKQVRLFLPRTLNFRALLAAAKIQVDGTPQTKIRWRKWRHHEVLTMSGIAKAETLSIALGDQTYEVPINKVDTGLADLNCLYTLSKDNNLDWIKDWARFHVTQQKADAVVFCDNGSTAYSAHDVLEALSPIPGLKAVRIVNAPLKYGPARDTCTNLSEAEFLQTSMMNTCLARFMPTARAILSVDVDEVVVSATNETIFAATAATPFGLTTFPGTWRYATAPNPGHADHIYVRASDKPCPTKYAFAPNGWLRHWPMHVHSLSGINRGLFQKSRRFHFLHCRNISTSWKVDRRTMDASDLTLDAPTQQVMSQAFSDDA